MERKVDGGRGAETDRGRGGKVDGGRGGETDRGREGGHTYQTVSVEGHSKGVRGVCGYLSVVSEGADSGTVEERRKTTLTTNQTQTN
ncbi:hypothetical protein Pmani_024681 [Petrolisthes manimaculis]|uniref:Uncharacterized protein n=1 Tax=Petrolisthes manimaculis TaxID=1843537 RepID=A0AAE1P9K5_9EUCA|nr:hypothetical protein Pmani_024681 [Petrolisthes manimaculis]